MNPGSDDLVQQLAAMSHAFAALGERLLTAARDPGSPGVPLASQLLEDVATSRQAFNDLRDRVRRHAEGLSIACPPASGLNTLTGIAELFEEARELECGKRRAEAV